MKKIVIGILLVLVSCSNIEPQQYHHSNSEHRSLTESNIQLSINKYILIIKEKYNFNKKQELCINNVLDDKELIFEISSKIKTYIIGEHQKEIKMSESDLFNKAIQNPIFRKEVLQPISSAIGSKCFEHFLEK
jgi:hypothetical protein